MAASVGCSASKLGEQARAMKPVLQFAMQHGKKPKKDHPCNPPAQSAKHALCKHLMRIWALHAVPVCQGVYSRELAVEEWLDHRKVGKNYGEKLEGHGPELIAEVNACNDKQGKREK